MDSAKIGIPRNEGIIEVKELLLLRYETNKPQVIKNTPKIIEKLMAFKPKNLNCCEMLSFMNVPINILLNDRLITYNIIIY